MKEVTCICRSAPKRAPTGFIYHPSFFFLSKGSNLGKSQSRPIKKQGGAWKKKCDVSKHFFWRLRNTFRFFFYRVFELPLLQNARKRDKNRAKQPREGEKKRRKKPHIFCDEPRWAFVKKSFYRVLNSPFYEALRNAIKQIDKIIK
jgi:hypothetical protein